MKNSSVSVPTMPRAYLIILAISVFTLSTPILPLRLKKSGISLTHTFFVMLQESPFAHFLMAEHAPPSAIGQAEVWQIKPDPLGFEQQFFPPVQVPFTSPQTGSVAVVVALDIKGNKKIQSMKMIRSFFCIGNRAN